MQQRLLAIVGLGQRDVLARQLMASRQCRCRGHGDAAEQEWLVGQMVAQAIEQRGDPHHAGSFDSTRTASTGAGSIGWPLRRRPRMRGRI